MVFVCLSTKAIHTEFAGDLSIETFITAFRRFTNEAFRCHVVMGEYGIVHSIAMFLAQNQIKLKFNTPVSSHFGGLYDACVKLIKFHLRRTFKNALLTYEEITSALAQIESILSMLHQKMI